MKVYYVILNKSTYSIREAILTDTLIYEYKEDSILNLIANEYLLYDIEGNYYLYALDTRFSENYEKALALMDILSHKTFSISCVTV
ncbi:MAG: hypothetical protein ACRCV3_05415 [Desulfovibrionaceae bacterium]